MPSGVFQRVRPFLVVCFEKVVVRKVALVVRILLSCLATVQDDAIQDIVYVVEL